MTDQELGLGRCVVYQVYPRSFQDSNGDGIGDLPGITSRLDYLADLGIDYLWLTPIFVSPMNDNGYDIADYRSIDPVFGTMADFEELVFEAGKRGISIMLDMVFNHSSTSHEWFRRAVAGEKRYQDYYLFREGAPDAPPTNWISKFGGSAWAWSAEVGKWYLHLFDASQADLNWENPAVIDELADIVRFWRDKGVGGFRFDVVNLISKPDALEDDFEGDGRRFYTDGPRVHEHIRKLVEKARISDMLTVGEMSSTSIDNCVLYSAPQNEELAMTFSFHHLKVDYGDGNKWTLKEPDIAELRRLFTSWQDEMTEGGGWNALFWSNHDQPRPVTRFACGGELRATSAKMLATCIHLMRGTPYIYQGEELGMVNPGFTRIDQYRDVESTNYYGILRGEGMGEGEALAILAERSRDNARTPMQWSAEKCAGFTAGTPWIEVAGNYHEINAESQLGDEDSVLAYYRRLIRLRRRMTIIQSGDVRFLSEDELGGAEKIIAYERSYGGERLLVLCSFDEREALLPRGLVTDGARVLIGNRADSVAGLALDGETFTLRPFEAVALIS
ncbi:alpha,alpha-phosphotrehalase [Coriobacteriales bacterium OH1046]|nr:alpha,alpha-phosphotrehalase [Coriobacteriales bacterium OH1046]